MASGPLFITIVLLFFCFLCLLVNVDTLAYTVPRATGVWPSLAITGPGACHVPCLLVCSHDRPAELLCSFIPGGVLPRASIAGWGLPPTMCGSLCAVFSTPRCTSARCGPLRSCLRWHAQLLPVQSAPCSFLIHHAVWPFMHDADALSGPSHPFCTARATFSLCFLSSHRNLRPAADNVD